MSALQIATPFHRSAPTVRRATPTRPARPAHPVTARPAARPVAAPASAARRPAASAPAPLRLTRRGRVVVTLLMLALVLVAAAFFSGRSAATGESGTPVQTRTVVVDQGDTMWGIASQVADGRDVRAVIHDIEELNALTGPELVEGQKIAVPVG